MKIETCLIADEQSHGLLIVRNETVQEPMAYFRRYVIQVTFQHKTAASIVACISVKLLLMN